MRTPFQINLMLARLSTYRYFLPRYNKHRESNWEALDCQIATIEGKLNEDQCWDRWPTHHQDQDLHNREKALEASKWLYNEGEDLIELWQKKGQS